MSELTIAQKKDLLEKTLSGKLQTKANEANSSTQAGFGDEFVPTDLSTSVLESVKRDETTVFSKLGTPVNMPTNPYKIPINMGDSTFYLTSENHDVAGTDVPTSKIGTGKLVLSAAKLSNSVYYTGEFDEDSITAVMPLVTNNMATAYKETLDNIIVNGDTTTAATGNVNSDDVAIVSGTASLAFDGLRKFAIDNGNTVNGGTLDAGDILTARKSLGKKGLDPTKLLLVVGPELYMKLLGLAQVETIEKFGMNASIVNGVLKAIYGIQIIASGQIGLTEADGKISATPANNTVGTAVMVYTPDIIHGFRRGLKTNIEYLPRVDQFCITAHVRYAMGLLGTAASTGDSVSSIINITV